ncbi:lantibiotic dehydratase [Streptomyces clavuligerus]|uniref:Lantibiotic dehydratase domain-containing protein n=1 Tax=Streptomyces clavuligerus TaxID=1901 RepID=B5GVE3_STRCL|nr:lantibiotic dehydratase [Streptomyces clavuligerus]ANW17970.1 lantibiotic dehydratase [Streptomyces clavuligerus]AXU12531.1 lantibiotic dehydratase [Streptomyces clavuligerus]EDY50289.1 lantibiotic dehydratase domain-containing protein [Streptomyces clavuligerus]EFG09461.1 Lantibiotic dehydratase domain-containing protein [Streptomyces clavuligerus]MBY6302427.1 lantibiotic dehydratase [Streptomyces clavuligerus]
MTATTGAGHRWQGVALLRATTSTGTADLPRTLDLDNTVLLQGWLARIWQRDDVREALRFTAPVLCETVEAVIEGRQTQARKIRRAVLSIASYLLRWQHRPTPLGLFAGTAPLLVGPDPSVSWGTKPKATVRADADWLTEIIQRLQASPGLRDRLPVMANAPVRIRDDRLVAPGSPADAYASHLAPEEIAVWNTRSLAAAMEAARLPIPYRELRECLRTRFPRAAAGQIDTLLQELVSHHLLITSLWAPMTTVDAFGHLCTELRKADAETVDEVRETVQELYAIHAELSRPRSDRTTLGATIARMQTVSSVTRTPVLLDTALDCEVRIPQLVVDEVQRAVAALYRITPQPYGYQHWRDYHHEFLAEYGTGTLVPVLDLVSDTGLGLPADYTGSVRERAPKQLTDRDGILLRMVQETVMAGRDELVLTDAMTETLAKAVGTDDRTLVPRVEVAFEIHSASTTALARGDFQLLVTGVPRPGSSMAGRFAHLLPTEHREALAATFTDNTGAVATQLSFAPRRRRNENVARVPHLLSHVIPLAEHREPEDGSIPLTDLAVTADDRSFHLVQISTGRPITVRVPHALEAAVQTPPLARFLAEIATARHAVYKPFDYGAAARLPYLPRVRYRRTVLTPARWLLAAQDLPSQTATTKEWDHAFDAWRERLRVPEHVTMTEHDQRLPLDLTHSVHRHILRTHLDGADRLVLRESPGTDAYGWMGRAHEVWLPLHTVPGEDDSERPARISTALVSEGEAHLPGAGTVLRARIYAHPRRYDAILVRHLPRLVGRFGSAPPMWWFTRRSDVTPHLDLVLHIEPGTYGTGAEHVHEWARSLHDKALVSNLTLTDFRPHPGEYGHGPALDAAHQLFAADSATVLAQIRFTDQNPDLSPQALAAASILDLVQKFAATPEHGEEWFIEHTPQGSGRLDRSLREQALGLSTPGDRAALSALPGGTEVVEAWTTRATAVRAYRRALIDQREPLTAARSLIHQHHARALGPDTTTEAATLRLARTTALHHRHRRQTR